MFTTKITESEIEPLAISSLPTRPNAPSAFGGKGYSAREMKECFDALPRLIIERLNLLIEELEGELVFERIMDLDFELDYPYTMADFLEDFATGDLASRLTLGEGGESVGEVLPELIEKVRSFYYMDEDYVLDAGRVSERKESM